MSFINYASKEINCKIVYYGPAFSGKTTNLQYIYGKTHPDAKGKMVTLTTETERTLYFDFLPLSLGTIRGFNIRFHLYTVPGQAYFDDSRKLILKGVDGIVFVADSQKQRLEEDVKSFENLKENMNIQGYQLESIPFVLQYNKRDDPDALALEIIKNALHTPLQIVEIEAIASRGIGVFETLRTVSKLILLSLKGE